MDIKTTVKTTTVRTRSVQLTEQDIKDIILAHFDMKGGNVDFDESTYGGINGAYVSCSISYEEGTEG